MILNRKIKIILFAVLSFILISTVLRGMYVERNTCMGVSLISENQLAAYTEQMELVFSDITYNNEAIATDIKTNTVYISQSLDGVDHFSNLLGSFKSSNLNYNLYFLNDANLNNIHETITSGLPLTLIVLNETSYYRLNVIISTLPIISIHGVATDATTEKGYPIYQGNMILSSGINPDNRQSSTKSYSLEWHLRGATSASLDKKPWKLSLKKNNGENLDAELLGMGEDDDWILNPMNLDDTKLREKTMMDLWNACFYDSQSNYPMSTGQYVEVVMNGDYQGLYLLQRRIDAKYLQLDKRTDILFKGMPNGSPATIYEGYELVSSPYDSDTSYKILEQALSTKDGISLNNYIKTNLFLQYFVAYDNFKYKNMFYVLREGDNGHELIYVPWDTDLSMGLVYDDAFGSFVYDYDTSIQAIRNRQEYDSLKTFYPTLDTMMSEKWFELYDSIFAPGAKLDQILEQNKQILFESGSFYRDNQRWGLYYGGIDTMENLSHWCEERTQIMNTYHK